MSAFSPDTLDGGHWAAGSASSIRGPSSAATPTLETLAARHIHAHNTDYNFNASVGLAYGVSHHLTISAELPYVRRDDLREGEHSHSGGAVATSVEQLGSVAGIGDLNLLAKYRVTGGAGPGFAIIAGIKVPTGSTHRRSPDGERLETEHQPGTGRWDPIVGASASATIGAVQLTGSALYQFSTSGASRRGSATGSRRAWRCRTASDLHPTRMAIRGTIITATSSTSITSMRIRAGTLSSRSPASGRDASESPARSSRRAAANGVGRARRALQFGLGLVGVRGGRGADVAAHPRVNPDNDYRLTLSLGRAF